MNIVSLSPVIPEVEDVFFFVPPIKFYIIQMEIIKHCSVWVNALVLRKQTEKKDASIKKKKKNLK